MFPRNTDPTREEMVAFLKATPLHDHRETADSIEFAIHAFATENYNGQFSNLYAALSASPVSSYEDIDRDWLEANDATACMMFDDLEAQFAG